SPRLRSRGLSSPARPSMIEPELRGRQQRPYHLSSRLRGTISALRQERFEQLDLFRPRRSTVDVPDREVNHFLGRLQLFEPAQKTIAAVAEDFLLDAIAVAEEQRFRHADLEIVARLLEQVGHAASAVLDSLQTLLDI